MLHTRTHKSRMAIKNEQLMSGYTGCIGCEQENLLDGPQSVQAMQEENELPIAVQLVQPQAALDEMAELEKKYRETIERENK